MATEGGKPTTGPWPVIAGAAAFVFAGLGPSALFLMVGLGEDQTADHRVSFGTLAFLIGVDAVVGVVLGLVVWAVTRSGKSTGTGIATVLLLAGAGVWGLVTGFLGAVGIAYERHPGWDDA